MKTFIITSIIVVANLFLLNDVAKAQFKMAGGSAQRSGYVDVEGPLTEPEIYWERSLGVRGESAPQPIIDKHGNIYVTGSPVNYKSWKFWDEKPKGAFVSFDPEGNERWRYEWSWEAESNKHTWSQLTGPVLAKDSLVLMGSRLSKLRCWNRYTGKLVWERLMAIDGEPITSTPVVDKEGFIYIHVRDIPTVRKMDAETGQYIWIHKFADGSIGNTSSPSLSHDEKTLYIARTKGAAYIYAINTEDGTYKWAWSPEKAKGHSFAWGIPIVDEKGSIYIQDEEFAHFYSVKDKGRIHMIEWAYKREGRDAPRVPAVNEEAIFSSYNNKEGHPVVFAVNKDGKEIWNHPLKKGDGIGGMLVTRKALYFGLNGIGKIYALNTKSGKVLWSKQVGSATGGFSEGLSMNRDGVIYAGVDGTEKYPDEACVVVLKRK